MQRQVHPVRSFRSSGLDARKGVCTMRFLILAAVAGAVALPTAANAQYYGGRGYGFGYGQGYGYGYNNRVQRERRECERELRHARNRWENQRELRECRREINAARYG